MLNGTSILCSSYQGSRILVVDRAERLEGPAVVCDYKEIVSLSHGRAAEHMNLRQCSSIPETFASSSQIKSQHTEGGQSPTPISGAISNYQLLGKSQFSSRLQPLIGQFTLHWKTTHLRIHGQYIHRLKRKPGQKVGWVGKWQWIWVELRREMYR